MSHLKREHTVAHLDGPSIDGKGPSVQPLRSGTCNSLTWTLSLRPAAFLFNQPAVSMQGAGAAPPG